jgi:fructokinase
VITVCGELVADLIEQPDGLLRPLAGGSPANTALACARLGMPVEFLGRFGGDEFGRRARDRLVAAGVGLNGSIQAREPSTLAVATTDAAGHARYAFWTGGTADWQWTDAELDGAPAPGTRAVHTASVASWTLPGALPMLAMVGRARAAGDVLVSYDPNTRPALMSPQSRDLIDQAIARAHLVKVSDEDLATLHPGTEPLDAAARWLSAGPSLVVVTSGPAGATALRAGRTPVQVPSAQVDVVDTIGAGDTFTAGLLLALLELLPEAEPGSGLRALSDDDVRRALDTAAAAAGITCTRAGCEPPTAAELAAALGLV